MRKIRILLVIVVIALVALDKASDTHTTYIYFYALEFYSIVECMIGVVLVFKVLYFA